MASILGFPDDNDNNGLVTLPSWIPNFGSILSGFVDMFTLQGISTFAACTSLKSQPNISSDGATLYLEASTLVVVGNACQPFFEVDGWEFRLALFDFAAYIPPRDRHTAMSGLEALAETCFAGTYATNHASGESALLGMLHFFRYGPLADPRNPDRGNLTRELEWKVRRANAVVEARHCGLPWAELWNQLEDESVRRLGEHFYYDSEKFLKWRSLFTTPDGYMGLGPSWIVQGDHVMLVKGGHVPYIFRHVDQILRTNVALSKGCWAMEATE